ncbi:RNA polymerase II mediator complex subunit MED8 NDAI_0C05530 [Naumovozyma dairenensis CBS 421]|uniref:Mediator of RNA polymerase II transcription subunit 8 n=1 Tax=Naumovozyma dairenensis (strain ATCC 10597 / BCRC 20456 / CBS 421 / NBRC 0211 / NRRL Y-12639) TaxID=1071378 RepID=G0W8V1_NAUDC|nr:hypothetical protein NDAI_0C05530 [Naumovozyma dairenensis CBS 421]CCD24212.1 hypothetical protein NDAI_0C05530 [Naumovozyma dairenensis CBS 421]
MSQPTGIDASVVPTNTLQDELKPNFGGIPTQALDAVRMRLAQLTHSLRKIRDDLSRAELPQWYSLQSQLNVTLAQLASVTSTLQHFQDTLDSTVVYPLPKFPTTSHENLLTTLLRKKNAPDVDEWINNSKEALGMDPNVQNVKELERSLQEDKDITKWALETVATEFEKHNFKNISENDLINRNITANTSYKPKKPFSVENILSFTYRGETKNPSEAA